MSELPGLPRFPYGAVYFRKSNPPPEDWERDYRTAAEDGMNLFRHWVPWSAVEVAPGEYDWADYDRQLDLAAGQGMKTILAELTSAAPEWAWRRYAHARYEARNGALARSQYSASCATGGFPGLCLDDPDVLAAAGRFLTALATRYRGHPGLAGYDVWNECNISPQYCYCAGTAACFREWLGARYASPRALGAAWRRYSYAAWEDVQPPRALAPYPEVLDWLRFRIDNAYRLLRWRVQTLRAADPAAHVVAHGVARSLDNMAPGACDDWRAAAEVEAWGYTWGAARHGDEPWKQWHAVDLVRAGARGNGAGDGAAGGAAGGADDGAAGGGATGPKPFWHAEAYAGALWLQPNVLHKPRDEGRIARPEDIRLWGLQSFAGGATGLMYLRWRPLLDGPLFGAFGAYRLDGGRTRRSEMAATLARWVAAPEQEGLWRARPVRGDVGILVAPESQLFCYAQLGNTEAYARSARGAYAGFFEHNVQPDWVHVDDLDGLVPPAADGKDGASGGRGGYALLYLPYPVHLSGATADRLRRWVAAGGTLVSEGCPGYWGDGARVGVRQPNLGLDALFGAREAYAEFTPDLLGDLAFSWQGATVPGGLFLQIYAPTSGTAVGTYSGDGAGPAAGEVAVVEHGYGRGRTLLVGTFPGYGHYHRPGPGSRRFFDALLDWAGVRQHVRVVSPAPHTPVEKGGRWWGPTARIHAGESGVYLWITNPAPEHQRVVVRALDERWAPAGKARVLWGARGGAPDIAGRRVAVDVPGRDGAVLQLA